MYPFVSGLFCPALLRIIHGVVCSNISFFLFSLECSMCDYTTVCLLLMDIWKFPVWSYCEERYVTLVYVSFGEHSMHFCWGKAYLWKRWAIGMHHASAVVDTERFSKFFIFGGF